VRAISADATRTRRPGYRCAVGDVALAQANVSVLRPGAEQAPALEAALQRIDLLAAMTPACTWRKRFQAAGLLPEYTSDAVVILNVSTWTSYAELHRFVYRSPHMSLVRNRQRWFERLSRPSTVLWWLPTDEMPALGQVQGRLELLRLRGPGPDAFVPRRQFDAQGRPLAAAARR
jgi:hypothetical protein